MKIDCVLYHSAMARGCQTNNDDGQKNDTCTESSQTTSSQQLHNGYSTLNLQHPVINYHLLPHEIGHLEKKIKKQKKKKLQGKLITHWLF